MLRSRSLCKAIKHINFKYWPHQTMIKDFWKNPNYDNSSKIMKIFRFMPKRGLINILSFGSMVALPANFLSPVKNSFANINKLPAYTPAFLSLLFWDVTILWNPTPSKEYLKTFCKIHYRSRSIVHPRDTFYASKLTISEEFKLQ